MSKSRTRCGKGDSDDEAEDGCDGEIVITGHSGNDEASFIRIYCEECGRNEWVEL